MPKTVICTDIDGNQHEVPIEKLSWRPSAYGIVIKDGKLLTPRHFGKHNLPGGGLDFGEMPEEALLREIHEETGIIARNPRLLAVHSTFFKLPFRTLPTQSPYIQSILLYYACEFAGGKFSLEKLDDHEKIYSGEPEWLPLEKLDEIELAGNDDWRDVVRQAMKLKQ